MLVQSSTDSQCINLVRWIWVTSEAEMWVRNQINILFVS